jgi:hypothetical protein
MPNGILKAYKLFQEDLSIFNAIAGGLGMPYKRRTGIPQGCPLSMVIVALILRPWMIEIMQLGMKPRTLADDILIIAQGPNHFNSLVKGVTATHRFLLDMGARIAPEKSTLFSTDAASRNWMSNHLWGDSEVKIGVVKSFRDLGGHLNVGSNSYSKTLIKRMVKAIGLVHRVGRLPLSIEAKAKIIRTKVLAVALYRYEASRICPVTLLKLRSAIKQVLGSHTSHKSTDFTFAVSSHGSDLDPEVVVLCRRILFIRRILTKRPHCIEIARRTWQQYEDYQYIGTDINKVQTGLCEIAPPLGKGSRSNWKPFFAPFGPIGVLLEQLHTIGVGMDENLSLRTVGEVPIETLHCPWQSLRPAVQDLGRRARTESAQGYRSESINLFEIDREATLTRHGDLTPDQHNLLHHFMQGAGWSKAQFEKTGHVEEGEVLRDLCGEEIHTQSHVVFDCCALRPQRIECDRILADLPAHILPDSLKIGIAPRMSAIPECTFLGSTLRSEDQCHDVLLGASDSFLIKKGGKSREFKLDRVGKHIIQDAKQIWGDPCTDAEAVGPNARQVMENCRHLNFASLPNPHPPLCTHPAPASINTFCDGSLKHPTKQMWALGGAGVWQPSYEHSQGLPGQLHEIGYADLRYNEGVSIVCALGGQQRSSTRTEMIGAYNALFLPGPVHIGIDSMSTLVKFTKLLKTAAMIEDSPEGCPEREARICRPFGKKRLGVTKNGDIWQKLWGAMLAKGSQSIKVTKVLGHATQEDIAQGKSTKDDLEGNHEADRLADEGVAKHPDGVHNMANWFAASHEHYTMLLRRI